MILVTGVSGFLGKHVWNKLVELKGRRHCISSSRTKGLTDVHVDLVTHDFCLNDIEVLDTVIHCAGLSSLQPGSNPEDLSKVNFEGTIKFAEACREKGARRFIYISSVKVNGQSSNEKAFRYDDVHDPQDLYGKSKSLAENALFQKFRASSMEVVVIRPTLIYGPGVKGNFFSIMNLINKRVPLPFGLIDGNFRSLVSIANLVDLIITCVDHPLAANQVFMASDDDDISTSELVKKLAKALNKPALQLPVPNWFFRLIAKVFNKREVVDRLIGSLHVDINHTKETLDWRPPQTSEQGFKDVVRNTFVRNR